jgi:gliding motility-associated-like protein
MRLLFISILFLLANTAFSQVYISDQATVSVKGNGLLFIENGDLENDGSLVLEGEIDLNGSFVNNDLLEAANFGTPVFKVSNTWTNNGTIVEGISTVILDGGLQTIAGTNPSNFYDLSLSGALTDIKLLSTNSSVAGTLNLSTAVLDVQTNRVQLLDPFKAIMEQGGFIETLYDGIVELASSVPLNAQYIVPFGYDPVAPTRRKLVLNSPPSGSYKMALIQGDPTGYGMSSASLQDSICRINDAYFWQIESDLAVGLGLETDPSESMFTRLSRWSGSLWEQNGRSALNPLPPFSHLSMQHAAGSLEHYTLSSETPFVDLEPDFEVFRNIKRPIVVDTYLPAGSIMTWSPDDQLTCSGCVPNTFESRYSELIRLRIINDVCEVEDQVMITVIDVPDVLVPNAFSPTLDALNETFIPLLADYETLVSIKIFNRWGQKIYEGESPWDGKYQGAIVSHGMYLYEVEFRREYSPLDIRTKYSRGMVMVVR